MKFSHFCVYFQGFSWCRFAQSNLTEAGFMLRLSKTYFDLNKIKKDEEHKIERFGMGRGIHSLVIKQKGTFAAEIVVDYYLCVKFT